MNLIRHFDQLDDLLEDELRILYRSNARSPGAAEASAGVLLHMLLASLKADARILMQAILNPDHEIALKRAHNACYIRNLRNSSRPGLCCEELIDTHTLSQDLILQKFIGRPKPLGIFVIQRTLTQDDCVAIAAAEAAGAECCIVYVKGNELFGQQAPSATTATFLLAARDMVVPPKLQRPSRPVFVISDKDLLRARRQRRNCCQFDEASFIQWIMQKIVKRKGAFGPANRANAARRTPPTRHREEPTGASDTPRIKGPRTSKSYEASAFDGPPPALQRCDAEKNEKMLIAALRERRESFKSRSSSHPTLIKDDESAEYCPSPNHPLPKPDRIDASSPISMQTWQEELNARAFARYQKRDKTRSIDAPETIRRKKILPIEENISSQSKIASSASLLRSSQGSSRSHSSLFGEPPARTHSIFGVQEPPSANRSGGRVREKLRVIARLGISRKRI